MFDHAEGEFGLDQAVSDLGDLARCLSGLVESPKKERDQSEIIEGLFSFIFVTHVVFYRILERKIRNVRVLHASRDVPRHF